jgi:23S rRNA pseudouridine1911/1915/1917 synthase
VRLDLLLIRRHPELSRRKARDVIEKGQVSVAGERVREPGRDVDEAAAVSFDPNRKALPRARSTLRVLFQDEHVLVLDKPAGLLSVPTGPGLDEDTALARAKDYARRLDPRAGYAERVHRLDRDTTGALAFALSREARAGLIEAFRGHRIERRYLALVAGQPEAEQGTIDAPLREEWLSGRRGVARPGEAARAARTHWRVRERLPGAALLEVRLETGRQHQVRVHLSHAGVPILGDPVYGPSAGVVPVVRRPMLHAVHLSFAHPITGARVEATSPLPPDFESTLKALRKGQLDLSSKHPGSARGDRRIREREGARERGGERGQGGARGSRATGGTRGGRAPSPRRRKRA